MVGHVFPELLGREGEEERCLEGFLDETHLQQVAQGAVSPEQVPGAPKSGLCTPDAPRIAHLDRASSVLLRAAGCQQHRKGGRKAGSETYQVAVQRCLHALSVQRGWDPAVGDVRDTVQPTN